jgi:hypothetical protein
MATQLYKIHAIKQPVGSFSKYVKAFHHSLQGSRPNAGYDFFHTETGVCSTGKACNMCKANGAGDSAYHALPSLHKSVSASDAAKPASD